MQVVDQYLSGAPASDHGGVARAEGRFSNLSELVGRFGRKGFLQKDTKDFLAGEEVFRLLWVPMMAC